MRVDNQVALLLLVTAFHQDGRQGKVEAFSCQRTQLRYGASNRSFPNVGIGVRHIHFSKDQDVDERIESQSEKSITSSKEDEQWLDKIAASFQKLEVSKLWDEGDETRLRISDLIRSIVRRLANLSLQDYYWRSDYFKKTEADRRVEESIALMMGEDPSYVRPMDASEDKIGPLGRAEKALVGWLSLVIEEEGRRARLIASSDGDLVRPMDLSSSGEGGPLSALENSVVTFVETIRASEKERVDTKTLRPKDLNEEKRGPLGNAEARFVAAINEIRDSERLRVDQSRRRGGEIVRPIDVPGPLGELERWYLELLTSEQERYKETNEVEGIVRPKDASFQGPLSVAERKFVDGIGNIKDEEKQRLKNIQKSMQENRPMEKDRTSALGLIEALLVGVLRGPQLLFRVIDRVKELLNSSQLEDSSRNENTKP